MTDLEHNTEGKECWCYPYILKEGDSIIVVHNESPMTPSDIGRTLRMAMRLLETIPDEYYGPMDELITDGFNNLDDALSTMQVILPENLHA